MRRCALKKYACSGTSMAAARNTTSKSSPMPSVSHCPTCPSAAGAGSSTSCATRPRLPARCFQATKVKIALSSSIFATCASCCLVNRLPTPVKGLRRLNCGVIGLKLNTQPPAPIALSTAAPPVSAANRALASSPIQAMSCSRTNMLAGASTVAASNANWRSMARCK